MRTCPALLIAIGNPPNLREAVDTMDRVEPDMDIADLKDDLAKTIVSEIWLVELKSRQLHQNPQL